MACFYRICRRWFGGFVGWIITLIIATTPLVILASRSATADIMYLALTVPVAIFFELSHSKQPSKLLYSLLFVSAALCLYTPGAIWLLLAGLAITYAGLKNLSQNFSRSAKWLNVALFLAVLTPLGFSIAHSWQVIKPLLLAPSIAHPLGLLKNVGWMALGLVWQTGSHSDLQIGRLAILNLAQIALAVFGAYAFWYRARNKLAGLVALIIIGIIGAGFSGQLGLLLFALVALGIIMAAGLRYLLIEWQGIFPHNPLPRSLALILICLVAAMSVYFGSRYSLVAWPHAVAVKQTFVLK